MRSFPSEERSKGTPEWNHYRVVCSNGVIRLHVNGKEVSGGEDCDYRKGYLGLESEGAPIDFRNLRILELPSSGAPADLTAPADSNWRSLFTGLDLRGWRMNSATATRWHVEGEQITLRPGPAECILWTDNEFGDANFILDCRSAKSASAQELSPPRIFFSTGSGKSEDLKLDGVKPGAYQRFYISVRGREVTVTSEGRPTQHLTLEASAPERRPLGLGDYGAGAEFMNIYTGNP